LSALSFLAGTGHVHIPHLQLHHGLHIPHGHVPRGGGRAELPWLNFGTISAFLAWFGGAGYLLEHYTTSGISWLSWWRRSAGWAPPVVFVFLAKVLMAHEAPLDPRITTWWGAGEAELRIRDGGTGELVFSQEGTRHVAGARSEDGAAIPKGAEVVVTRYERALLTSGVGKTSPEKRS